MSGGNRYWNSLYDKIFLTRERNILAFLKEEEIRRERGSLEKWFEKKSLKRNLVINKTAFANLNRIVDSYKNLYIDKL
mgnify:CR=1 FL=1